MEAVFNYHGELILIIVKENWAKELNKANYYPN